MRTEGGGQMILIEIPSLSRILNAYSRSKHYALSTHIYSMCAVFEQLPDVGVVQVKRINPCFGMFVQSVCQYTGPGASVRVGLAVPRLCRIPGMLLLIVAAKIGHVMQIANCHPHLLLSTDILDMYVGV